MTAAKNPKSHVHKQTCFPQELAGGTCQRHLAEARAGGTCLRHLPEALAGGTCRRHLPEARAGGIGWRHLQREQQTSENKTHWTGKTRKQKMQRQMRVTGETRYCLALHTAGLDFVLLVSATYCCLLHRTKVCGEA